MEDLPKVTEHTDGDDSTSEPGDEVYIVEAIQGKRFTKKGGVEYYIKWKGYDKVEDNTWEPAANCQCPELIEQYEKDNKTKSVGTPGSDSRKRGKSATRTSSENREKGRRDKESSKENTLKGAAHKMSKAKEMTGSSSDSDSDEPTEKRMNAKDDAALPEPMPGKTYEIESGKQVSAVLGVKKSDKNSGLVALVRYSDNNYELVPTSNVENAGFFFSSLYSCLQGNCYLLRISTPFLLKAMARQNLSDLNTFNRRLLLFI